MKKFFIGSSQIITFWIIYEILSFLGACIVALILAIPSWIFGSNGDGTLNRAGETLVYTLAPGMIGHLLAVILSFLYSKTKLYTIPCIINFAILAWLLINHLISIASQYGIFSWDTINQIWYDVILCIFIIKGLQKVLPIKIKTENNIETPDNFENIVE